MTIETELPAVKVSDMAEASSNGPVAWRYRLEGWGEQYWHYFTKEPRYKEAGEIWQPLYLQPGGITAAEIERLRRENEHFTKSGIIEVAVRNISVSDYMNHWEGRALAAESRCEELVKALEEALDVFEIYADPAGYTDGYGDLWPSDAEQHEGLLAKGAADKIRTALAAYQKTSDDLKEAEGVGK